MRSLIAILLCLLVLSACRYPDYFVTWRKSCPGFPTLEEAEQVVKQHKDLFERMEKDVLTHSVSINECPQGAYITIYYGGEWQVPLMLEMMDEVNAREGSQRMFFGVPFHFANV